MSAKVRVGVIGGGLIAQAVHLPTLAKLPDRFDLVALADPSQTVREALGARWGLRTHADWRDLISTESLDAVIVGSPNGTHLDIVLAALECGLHVLVEKPLCIDAQDVETICARREQARRVVQVGYQKRYDAGYEALLAALPATADDLRFIDVVTYDPWMARAPFAPADLVVGSDVPEQVLRQGAQREREQVQAAVGVEDPAAVKVFSNVFVGALVHDINLVHGVLAHLGVELPARPTNCGYLSSGNGADVAFRLGAGIAWQTAWLLLEGLEEFSETASFYFGDEIHRLRFSSPYLREHATVHEIVGASEGAGRHSRSARIHDSYLAELEHFHACIAQGAQCRTPPEQARLDLIALRDAFLLSAQEVQA
ncbi:MAG: Gfo/Idh/MocA family oxidoreductase [Solirubrobacteraceae bacterium]